MSGLRCQFEGALRWALLVVAAILFAAIARDAFRLEMGDRLHPRYWAHAFPAIISAWDHGLAWDFTAYRGVMELLVNTVVANVLIPDPDAATALDAGERALQAASIASGFDKSIVLVPYDDKGYADLARISFRLFGVHVPSILKGYLLLLGISIATYLLQFRQNIRALVVLDFVLMGIYAGMFAFPLSRELGQVTNPRAIGLLSWVALVHILYALLHPVRLSRNGIAAIGIQTSIIYLVFFCRSPESWQIALIAVAGFGSLAYRSRRDRSPTNSPQIALVGLFSGAAILTLYQWVTFHPAYFDSHGQYRLTWHNVGIGFALHPDLAREYDLQIGDNGMFRLVEEKARSLGLHAQVFSGNDTVLLNPISDFTTYDRLARSVVIDIARRHPVETAYLFFYYKPMEFIHTMLRASDLESSEARPDMDAEARHISRPERDRLDAYLRLFRPLSCLAFLVAAASIFVLTMSDVLSAAAIISLSLVGSLVPGFLSYPVYHIVGMSFATAASFLYFLGYLAVWVSYRLLAGTRMLCNAEKLTRSPP
jgi:hypothetical protein